MPKRKTPQSRNKLFSRFDELNDDQFLELREAVGDYFGSNFVEEEEEGGEASNGGKTENRGGNDGGWVTKFFGE